MEFDEDEEFFESRNFFDEVSDDDDETLSGNGEGEKEAKPEEEKNKEILLTRK